MSRNPYEEAKHEVDTVRAYRQIFMSNAKVTRAGQKVLDDLAEFGYVHAFEHKNKETGENYDKDTIQRITGRKELYNRIMFWLNYDKEAMRQNKKAIRDYDKVTRGE